MGKIVKNVLLSIALAVGVLSPLVGSTVVYAQQNPIQAACDASTSASALCDDTEGRDVNGVIQIIVNVLLFVVGLISVIMIIVGGIKYSVSGGDSGSVSSAKNTILYAVIGLVAAFLAYAIVYWVLNLF